MSAQTTFFSLSRPVNAMSLDTGPAQVFALTSDGAARSAGSELSATQRSFAEVLAIADRGPQDASQSVDEARRTAEELVATTLVQPILKQLRESNTAPPPFGPSKGEQQFRAMSDAHTAKEIVRSGQFGLVDRLARDMRERSEGVSAAIDVGKGPNR